MEVRIINGLAGEGRMFNPGEIVDVPEPIAQDWIRAKAAVPTGARIETAMIEPRTEKAMRPKPTARRAR